MIQLPECKHSSPQHTEVEAVINGEGIPNQINASLLLFICTLQRGKEPAASSWRLTHTTAWKSKSNQIPLCCQKGDWAQTVSVDNKGYIWEKKSIWNKLEASQEHFARIKWENMPGKDGRSQIWITKRGPCEARGSLLHCLRFFKGLFVFQRYSNSLSSEQPPAGNKLKVRVNSQWTFVLRWERILEALCNPDEQLQTAAARSASYSLANTACIEALNVPWCMALCVWGGGLAKGWTIPFKIFLLERTDDGSGRGGGGGRGSQGGAHPLSLTKPAQHCSGPPRVQLHSGLYQHSQDTEGLHGRTGECNACPDTQLRRAPFFGTVGENVQRFALSVGSLRSSRVHRVRPWWPFSPG